MHIYVQTYQAGGSVAFELFKNQYGVDILEIVDVDVAISTNGSLSAAVTLLTSLKM